MNRCSRRSRSGRAFIAALSLMAVAAGCAQKAVPDLALVYDAAAQHHGVDRNPIIVIPGLLGSALVEEGTGRTVWGAFDPSSLDPSDPADARTLALPLRSDVPLAEARDQVVPAGVLERLRIRLLGIPLEVQAYAGVLQTLGAGGYRDEALGLAGQVDYGDDHYTCFQFGYDWRRDNVETAQRLYAFMVEKREQVRRAHADVLGVDVATQDIRFDIVAHSMGALVVRYLLMYGDQPLPEDGSLPELTWAGAGMVERAVYVGPPNAGSAQALLQLVEGRKMAPLLPYYPAALLGSFPSAYQLLPRPRHGAVVWDGDADRPVERLMDVELWDELGWGLASPDQAPVLAALLPDADSPDERRALARAYLARVLARAEAFHRALDREIESQPEGLEQLLVAGDATGTPARLSVSSADGRLRVIEEAPGDGSVLRSSALLDERTGGAVGWTPWTRTPIAFDAVLFLPDEHLALTRNPVFSDNVLYWLLEEPRRRSAPWVRAGDAAR